MAETFIMKKYLQEFLTYRSQQRKAIIGLISLLVLLMIGFKIYDRFGNKELMDISKFSKEINDFNQNKVADDGEIIDNPFADNPNNYSEGLMEFDPNTTTETQWKQLGMSDRQTKTILNFVAKGGKFRTKADLKKIYGISDEEFDRLSPYITILPTHHDSIYQSKTGGYHKPKDIILELNTADTITLTQLPGIGPSFAKRIIKYRDLLGGFAYKEQLFEVYGFDSLHFNQLENNVTVNADKIKRININLATFNELKSHPYIKYPIANAIVNYRKQHGNYAAISDLKRLVLIDDEIFRKFAPYLKTDDH